MSIEFALIGCFTLYLVVLELHNNTITISLSPIFYPPLRLPFAIDWKVFSHGVGAAIHEVRIRGAIMEIETSTAGTWIACSDWETESVHAYVASCCMSSMCMPLLCLIWSRPPLTDGLRDEKSLLWLRDSKLASLCCKLLHVNFVWHVHDSTLSHLIKTSAQNWWGAAQARHWLFFPRLACTRWNCGPTSILDLWMTKHIFSW